MKRFLFMLFAALMTLTAAAYDFMVLVDNVTYCCTIISATERTVSISIDKTFGGNGILSCDIPEKVTKNGTQYTVTAIGNAAFYDCSKLTSVTIPSTVTIIDEYAFYNCFDLSSVTLPTGVTSIGRNAFENCYSMTSINIPTTVTNIGQVAFQNCTFTEITIPSSVKSIEAGAFCGCTDLTKVTLEEGVESIGENAFVQCQIETINIPNTVTYIGASAFKDCANLSSFSGNYASVDGRCLVINNEIVSFAPGGLTSYAIPSGVTSIGCEAFTDCKNLTSINIPNSVTSIGRSAFYYCPALTNVSLGNSITTIGSGAFSKTAFYNDDKNWEDDVLYIGNYLIEAKTSLTGSYAIKEGTRLVAAYAFSSCKELSTVTIPNSVTSIDYMAFGYCRSLNSLTVENSDPANILLEGSRTFYDVPTSTCVLYVPKGSAELYAAADQWKDFANIVEFINSVELVDGTAYSNDADMDCETITYTRNFTSTGWQALYLPFDINYDEWEALGDIARLNNVHQYDTDGDEVLDKTTIEFNRVTSGTIKAHTPCVFRPKAAGEVVLSVSDRTLYAAPAEDQSIWCASTELLYTLYGTYNEKSGLYGLGAYALSPDGNFVKAEKASQILNPYRIYLIISDKTGMTLSKAPMRIAVRVDGEETTGIEGIEVIMPADGIYYDLMGRPVQNPERGIYIQNGKKVYVK